MLIGRKKEIKSIKDLMRQKKNIFIFGKEGVGKTFFLRSVLDSSKSKDLFYSQDSSCLRNALQDFLEPTFNNAFLSSQNILAMRKLIYKNSKDKNKYFVFDHVQKSSSRLFSLVEYLLEHVPVIMVGRGPYYKDIGTLSQFLWNFKEIEVGNLSKKYSDALMDYFINSSELPIPDQQKFKSRVCHLSQGNPGIIEEICQYARDGRYCTSGAINLDLLNLDRKISRIKL